MEVPVVHRDLDFADRRPFSEAREHFAADVGKHGVGDHGIDHARAALEFGAPLGNEFGNIGAVGEWHLVAAMLAADVAMLPGVAVSPVSRQSAPKTLAQAGEMRRSELAWLVLIGSRS